MRPRVDDPVAGAPRGEGRLAENVLHFARALRAAGLPVGSGAVIDALDALSAVGLGDRRDFEAVLRAVFVKRHEHIVVFRQVFDIFWRRRNFMEKLIALMSPAAEPKGAKKQKAEAGATRVADALMGRRPEEKAAPSLDLDARLTMSSREVLQTRDFAQMSAAEIAAARAEIARLRLADDETPQRRFGADARGRAIDPRRSFRRSLRAGGAAIDLARRSPRVRPPPIVALCDISGSMSDYTRVFLHFLHALAERRGRVHAFVFGTRLTNVTRALRARDVDEALAATSAGVKDWAGGTRIAGALHAFNRDWSRRVLGQGAVVLLFTDGLERDDPLDLAREMERLRKSCRRLIWLNPLLRFDGFEAKAVGIRAMLPFVDEFRAIHNLAAMRDLCAALSSEGAGARGADPRLWIGRAA